MNKKTSSPSPNELSAALERCASEPVHQPGAIQSFGVLLCLDKDLQKIRMASANAESLLEVSASECIGMAAGKLLGSALLHRLQIGLRSGDHMPGDLTTSRKVAGESVRLHVLAYRSADLVVVELEPEGYHTRYRWLSLVNRRMEELLQCHSEQAVIEELVKGVRQVTGFDRALLYRFDDDFNGLVEAESRNERLPSMLHHRFPASDIPPQVRALYERNRLRVIADCDMPAVPLVPALHPDSGKPVDIGYGVLRAASPIHCEYMRNMGVRASMSIAIFSRDRLWGLVACHHHEARTLTSSMRDSSASLVKMASQRLFLLKADAHMSFLEHVHRLRVGLSRELQKQDGEPMKALATHGRRWLKLFQASGMALVYRRNAICVAAAPGEEQVMQLRAWLEQYQPGVEAWSTRSLVDEGVPNAEALGDACCGLLAMPLVIDRSARGWLLFFRPEEQRTIIWAGRPEKELSYDEQGVRLSPRSSFDAWQETTAGRCLAWQEKEMRAARDLGDDLALLMSADEISRLNEVMERKSIDLARANENLKQLAFTDSLTGVMNRYRIEHLVQLSIANGRRYEHEFSLLLFDIDHFKKVNDDFGHDEGDRILRQLVEVVKGCLRESDQLGRWGGEEFLILMSGTDLDGAGIFAERVRKAVADADFGLPDGGVTISIGVVAWHRDDSLKALLVRADQAMYAAKENGRNQVKIGN